MTETFWNGLPTPAVRGTAEVADSPAHPLYWARELVGQRVPVVRVTLDGVNYGGGVAYLYDEDGHGWIKVTKGQGSSRVGHKDLAVVEGSFRPA